MTAVLCMYFLFVVVFVDVVWLVRTTNFGGFSTISKKHCFFYLVRGRGLILSLNVGRSLFS